MKTKPIRIMPLGDSITAGYTDNPIWNHPFSYGYRAPLYALLTEAQIPFTFVGASAEPWNMRFGDPAHNVIAYSKIPLKELGQDNHRGYGGWTIQQITSEVNFWIQEDDPDLILLMIGINSISPESPKLLKALVETIFRTHTEVSLLVAQISPLMQFNQDLVLYNTYIRDILVPSFRDQGFSIASVDQYSSYLSDTNNKRTIQSQYFSNGINHPTNSMYGTMAEIWFAGICSLMQKF